MTGKRDEIFASQREYLDDVLELTDGEVKTRRRFEAMALETFDALSAADSKLWVRSYSIWP